MGKIKLHTMVSSIELHMYGVSDHMLRVLINSIFFLSTVSGIATKKGGGICTRSPFFEDPQLAVTVYKFAVREGQVFPV